MSGPISILTVPSLFECFRFPLRRPIKEMLRFQSLPFYIFLRPQFRSPTARFRSRRQMLLPWHVYVGFRVPSKGSFPPGSHRRTPTEKDCQFLEPYCICLSKSLIKQTPPLGSPTVPLWQELPLFRTFIFISPGVPNKRHLLVKENLTILSSPR